MDMWVVPTLLMCQHKLYMGPVFVWGSRMCAEHFITQRFPPTFRHSHAPSQVTTTVASVPAGELYVDGIIQQTLTYIWLLSHNVTSTQ